MDTVKLSIDGQQVEVPAGTTILEAARKAGIYIPTLCYHPDLPPAKNGVAAAAIYQGAQKLGNAMPQESGRGCGLCAVEVKGQNDLAGSCAAAAEAGMVVITNNDRIQSTRQQKLLPIMTRHRHACLTCAQQQGCSRTRCSSDVPEKERCCSQFGHCELQNVANYVGLLDSTPKWVPTELAPLKDHPLFEIDYSLCIGCTRCVRACRDLRGIEALGFIYDEQGQLQIGTVADTFEASGCKFCTACVEVCPTGALVDKAVDGARREDALLPCRAACPAHIDIPGYLRMIAGGKADEANAIVCEKVPFPGVLGRLCTHPCEEVCLRGEVDESISICALKRYAADTENELWKNESRVAADTGKKVAVVGAGPAGLTAAFYLRKQGHAVTLLDADRRAGGMMRYGIPEYRLPRKVLDKEIKDILAVGIEFQANQCLGKEVSLDQLKNDGYDAVFLGVGAQKSQPVPLEGCTMPDVFRGLEFLRNVAQGQAVQLKDKVVVIGGGNVAVDAAMTARRCGATDVTLACLEGLNEMPAGQRELEGLRAEGIDVMPSRGPLKIMGAEGHVTGLDLAECTGVFDEDGNFCPVFSETKECIPVDQVIIAVGQAADLAFIEKTGEIKIRRGLIVVDEESLATGLSGVYAGGDAVKMPGTIIHAIAAGRRAAASIDRALGGSGKIDETLFPRADPDPHLGRDDGFGGWGRQKMPELEAGVRVKNFDEIATGLSAEQAVKEARRCLQCDLRLQIGSNPAPPAHGLVLDEKHVNQVPEAEGVLQLLDADRQILSIKGSANLRRDLLETLADNEAVFFFEFEEDKLFSQRESELIQKYLQEHGAMPGGGRDDLDDLY
jgi:formate dehydrogenase beta subunit